MGVLSSATAFGTRIVRVGLRHKMLLLVLIAFPTMLVIMRYQSRTEEVILIGHNPILSSKRSQKQLHQEKNQEHLDILGLGLSNPKVGTLRSLNAGEVNEENGHILRTENPRQEMTKAYVIQERQITVSPNKQPFVQQEEENTIKRLMDGFQNNQERKGQSEGNVVISLSTQVFGLAREKGQIPAKVKQKTPKNNKMPQTLKTENSNKKQGPLGKKKPSKVEPRVLDNIRTLLDKYDSIKSSHAKKMVNQNKLRKLQNFYKSNMASLKKRKQSYGNNTTPKPIQPKDQKKSPKMILPSSIAPLEKQKHLINTTPKRIQPKDQKRSPKMILPWNLYYGNSLYRMGSTGIKDFCPNSGCYVSTNKSLLSRADAILFHMWPSDMWKSPPKFRLPHQRYVFLLNESPSRKNYRFENFNHFFNLTMTYRLDSDIPFVYGSKHRRNHKNIHERFVLKSLKTKAKPVVWIVSHCKTDSKREEYVKELAKHINIDVYGRCGNLTCWPPRSHDCYTHFGKNYKFVLSFENSICRDYITEKVYQAVRGDIVPVVYGGADYKKLLPPNSFINVADFETPKHLADYLLWLHHNDAAYLKFFEWKDHYVLSDRHDDWKRAYCRLCDILQDPNYPRKSYSSGELNQHWGAQNCDSHYLDKLKKRWHVKQKHN